MITYAPTDYKKYLKAKYYHTSSVNFENQSNSYYNPDKNITIEVRKKYLDSALKLSLKARDLYMRVKIPDRKFQYDLQNRIYHQTAYLGNWKHALEQAKLGYEFLKDTLSEKDKTFVDLIYDFGFIYSNLGDYSKAVENYQKSLDLYRSIIGENHTDVAQAYNNTAIEYRFLGLRKKELESLLKAKNIWETINNEDDRSFLYKCYRNLFYWYSYYGDFEKAEEYILKIQKLRNDELTSNSKKFLRNKEEIYEDKLSEWYNLMLHYSRKNDTLKTIFYAQNIIKTIPLNKKLLVFETSILSSTLNVYASLLRNTKKEKALELLNMAIDIQDRYKTIFYTKSLPYKLNKVEMLLEFDKVKEAETELNKLNVIEVKDNISKKFKLYILKAKIAQTLQQNKKAENYFERAFSLLKNTNTSNENCFIEDLKPLISFETIESFLAMGDFYFQEFKTNNTTLNLQKAGHRYLLASKIYNQLYLGQYYNNRLYTTYNEINERLLSTALIQKTNTKFVSDIINSIENNGSKLTWSKFVYNNMRNHLNLPESLIDKEENLKLELNFYKKALMTSKEESEEKLILWKDKIYRLNEDLLILEDSIKQQNKTYYQLNVKGFDIEKLQATLKKNQVILKYIFTQDKLYSFLITKNKIELPSVIDKANVLSSVKTCLNNLKNRNQNYKTSIAKLKSILFDQMPYENYNKLVIIPDGALHYVPFEALILSENMPTVSYASSMLMYQEQNHLHKKNENLKIGAFSASNTNSKLPKASDEIQDILKIFEGNYFINATKSEFLQHANQFNVLHLAMHSDIDDKNPELSSLNFFGSDNKLFVSELYNKFFKANMVVLSACDTGTGFYQNGEGVISISRAFNFSGIPSTVMSLWKVDDEATAKIMTYFYKHLHEGEEKDEALKNAKLDYLKNTGDELLKHPYYWSGFVISGNTHALKETNNYWLYLSILPLMALGIFRKRLFQFFKK